MAKPRKTPPNYRVIASDLLELIDSGVVGPDQRLPTEAELVERYGVTRPTVRQAYRVLMDNNRVAHHGLSGYYVKSVKRRHFRLAESGRYRALQLSAPVSAPAAEPRTLRQEVSVELLTAEAKLRDRPLSLWFERGDTDPDEYVCRNVLHTVDYEPSHLTSTYLPLHLGEGTAFRRPQEMEQDAATFLAQQLGEEVSGFSDHLSGRIATEREMRLLELQEATMVFELIRQVWFLGGVPLMLEKLVVEAVGAEFEHDIRTGDM